jgi:hypothetical protein
VTYVATAALVDVLVRANLCRYGATLERTVFRIVIDTVKFTEDSSYAETESAAANLLLSLKDKRCNPRHYDR